MPIETILGLIAVLAVIAAIIIISEQMRERRRALLAGWAATNGFSFTAEKDRGIADRFDGFELFRKGSNRYAYNISSGNVSGRERSAYAFDYHYETVTVNHKGQAQTQHHNLSAIVISTGLRLRQLHIRDENFFDKVGEFFGLDDIDFELAEFNDTFHVRAPDRRWAFDVLHQKAMEFMLASPRFTMEFNDGRVLVYRNLRFQTADFDDALALANGLIDMLPPSVLRELSDSR
jgi:hypothetical protein